LWLPKPSYWQAVKFMLETGTLKGPGPVRTGNAIFISEGLQSAFPPEDGTNPIPSTV
jgi:hypothetical protein